MPEIKKYKISELGSFIQSPGYLNNPVLPVSKQRVISYINNPRANVDDYVLYVLYEDEHILAYRTLLPDKFIFEEEEVKFAWLSGNWVSPDRRREGFSTLLFREIYDDWNGMLCYTNYAPESKKVYDKTKEFVEISSKAGFRFYFRMSLAKLLAPKHPFFRKTRFLWHSIDFLFNIINELRIAILNHFYKIKYPFEYLPVFDEECYSFIKKYNKQEIIQRGEEELSWIWRFPWIITKPMADINSQRYFFSQEARQFHRLVIKLYSPAGKNLAAVMMITIKDKTMKVPVLYFDPESSAGIWKIIIKQALSLKVNYLTIANEPFLKMVNQLSCPCIFRKSLPAKYFATKNVSDNYLRKKKIHFHDGDGDVIFT